MIQDVPVAIYIDTDLDLDISFNLLPLSIEIVPHTAHNATAVIVPSVNNIDYKCPCERFVFIIFSIIIISATLCFLFFLSK